MTPTDPGAAAPGAGEPDAYPTGPAATPSAPQHGRGNPYPPGAGAYPPGAGAYPPGAGPYPPGAGPYPPGAGAYPPGAGAYPGGAHPAAPQPAGYPAPASCYRHPGRQTLIGCQRCGRPICPECMTSASVGVHCPECVAAGIKDTRADRLPYGGRRVAQPMLTSGVLLAINVAVWLLLTLTGGGASPWYDRLALLSSGRCVPVNDPTTYAPGIGEAACRAVGGAWQWVPGVIDGAVWQLFTSAFTHVDLLHLASNMLMLMITGPVLERFLGRARFLAIYLLSALGGSVAVLWFTSPGTSTVGASGAIFGLMGALLVLTAKVRANLQNIAFIVGVNLVATFSTPGVSWAGHLGGLATGAALGALLVFAPRERRTVWQCAGVAAATAGLLALVALRVAAG